MGSLWFTLTEKASNKTRQSAKVLSLELRFRGMDFLLWLMNPRISNITAFCPCQIYLRREVLRAEFLSPAFNMSLGNIKPGVFFNSVSVLLIEQYPVNSPISVQ